MITQGEIDDIRQEQLKFMPDKVIIKRREFFGDTEHEYHPIDDKEYPARITAGYGTWRVVADRFQGITAFTITMAWDSPIQAGDLVVQGGRAFEVRDVKAPGSYLTAKQCLCDLVTDA
jgi:hypothetical protein